MNHPSPQTQSVQRGLFDNLNSWLFDPVLTFSSWVETHPVEESTREVKEYMWGKWCTWLESKRIRLDAVISLHLASFFKDGKVEKAQRQRYLRLIETVYTHLNLLGLSLENPGTQAGYAKLGKGENDATVFLKEEEKEKVEKVIKEWLTYQGGPAGREEREEKKRRGRKKQDWMFVRDAAICAAMIGAGATVLAIERLTVSCTNCTEGKIALPRKGSGDYEALLLPIGQIGMEAWLRLRRREFHDIGDWLFPADIGSRRNPDTITDTPAMHASTIFRAVRRVLTAAGVTGARACGQTLRNTYGATLISLGLSDDEIATYMGFYEPKTALLLRVHWGTFSGMLNTADGEPDF